MTTAGIAPIEQRLFPFAESDDFTRSLLERAQGKSRAGIFIVKHTVELHNPSTKEAAISAIRIAAERQRLSSYFPSSNFLLYDPTIYPGDALTNIDPDGVDELVESTAIAYSQLQLAGCGQIIRPLGPIALEKELIDEGWLLGRRVFAGISTDEKGDLAPKAELLAGLHNPLFLEIPISTNGRVSAETEANYKFIRDTLRARGGREIAAFILKLTGSTNTSEFQPTDFIAQLNYEHPDKLIFVDAFSETKGDEGRFEVASAKSGIDLINKKLKSYQAGQRVVNPRIHGLLLNIAPNFDTLPERSKSELNPHNAKDSRKPSPPETASRVLCPGTANTTAVEIINAVRAR